VRGGRCLVTQPRVARCQEPVLQHMSTFAMCMKASTA
jgi:hypothetical protein